MNANTEKEARDQDIVNSIESAKDLANALRIARKAVEHLSDISEDSRNYYIDTLAGIEMQINAQEAITSEQKEDYQSRIALAYRKAADVKRKWGGLVGLLLKHKIIVLIVIVALVVFKCVGDS